MSQDEQDAIIGKIVRERKELAQKLGMLQSKANAQGATLQSLGRSLLNNPEFVAFEGVSSGANNMQRAQWFPASDYPSFEDIWSVGNEIREIMDQQESLEQRAKPFGI